MTSMLCGHQKQTLLSNQIAFDFLPPPVTARTHDPVSSHINVRRIQTNKGLAKLVLTSIQAAYTIKNEPVNDDDLLAQAELLSATRQQRNVLAKVRGVLEANGYIQRVPSNDRVCYIPIQKD